MHMTFHISHFTFHNLYFCLFVEPNKQNEGTFASLFLLFVSTGLASPPLIENVGNIDDDADDGERVAFCASTGVG